MARVLFVCLHNAGRSQISEALFRKAAGTRHECSSAGSTADPEGKIHANVLEAMGEIGVDLSHASPNPLTYQMAEQADVIVTMGCGDACPIFPGKRYLDWDLPDPKNLELDEVRVLRDEIARRVEELVSRLDANRS